MSDLFNFKNAIKALSPEFVGVRGDYLHYSDHKIIKEVFEILTASPVSYKDDFIVSFYDHAIGNEEYKKMKVAFKKLENYHFKKSWFLDFWSIL